MQDHKRIEELIVPVDGTRDLRPTLGVDRATIEQLLKLEHGVSNLPFVCAHRRAQTRVQLLSDPVAMSAHDGDGLGTGVVVERRPWHHVRFEKTPGLDRR